MDRLSDIRCALHRNLAMVVGVCLCLYFSYHILAGHRSYSRLSHLSYVSQQKSSDLIALKKDRSMIEVKVRMMRPDSLSVDMVEEQARLVLGYKRQGELVVVTN